jgi:RND family efflux transporter MFP subunit
MSKNKSTKTRKIWIPIILIVVLAAGGAGYYYYSYSSQSKAAAAATASSVQTSKVKRGNITISATGTGTLTASASQTADLTFSTSGVVASVAVQVGDQVKKGQILAKLDNIDQLQAKVNIAQQNLVSVQHTLDTYKQSAAANLANAQIAVLDDQEAVKTAKSGVIVKGMKRCDSDAIEAYFSIYNHEKEYLESLGSGAGNPEYYNAVIAPEKSVVASAYATYVYCAGFTDYEISSSEATLSLAQANLKTAQDTLTTLQKNDGLDPTTLANDQNSVDNAQVTLDEAKTTLAGATLTAPFDGVILTMAGQAGYSASTDTAFITMADLNNPKIDFTVDETDMDKVAIGEEATVTFDAIENKTFTGKVIQINPQLQTSSGYGVVEGLIQLDLSKETTQPELMSGLNASVKVIQSEAKDVLLVPVEAVRDLGDGSYGVFVLDSLGQPKLQVVKVGLEDVTNAEIQSGVKEGDVVTTGITETK